MLKAALVLLILTISVNSCHPTPTGGHRSHLRDSWSSEWFQRGAPRELRRPPCTFSCFLAGAAVSRGLWLGCPLLVVAPKLAR